MFRIEDWSPSSGLLLKHNVTVPLLKSGAHKFSKTLGANPNFWEPEE